VKGISLSILRDDLKKVSKEHDEKPAAAIVDIDKKIGPLLPYLTEQYDDFNFLEHYYRLSLKMLTRFSFDELCKLKYSTFFCMEQSVDRLFEDDPRYEVVRKIENSMWRWGMNKGTWSEVVDAYENIRHFTFVDDPDFTLRLDHTTGCNEFGRSNYARVFIDGVFAFLVYYKGEHVMTIGFTLMAGRRLLIQQVQSAKRSGNRYLFKLPQNRLEMVIGLFRQHFPGYELSVVGGKALVAKTLADYTRSLERAKEHSARYRVALITKHGPEREDYERYLAHSEEEIAYFKAAIAHLEEDKPRLMRFYSDTGRYALGKSPCVVAYKLSHFRVAA
jgi:hypothetical protein